MLEREELPGSGLVSLQLLLVEIPRGKGAKQIQFEDIKMSLLGHSRCWLGVDPEGWLGVQQTARTDHSSSPMAMNPAKP